MHLLLELLPGGAKKFLSADQAKALLATVRPRDVVGRTRRRLAAELIVELCAIDQRIKTADKDLSELLAATGSTLSLGRSRQIVVAHLAAAPFYDNSTATVAHTPGGGATVDLALTDPDSSTLVPRHAPRFAGDFMLDAQGDQQAVFAAHLGSDDQQLSVLNLSQSVDDTAFAAGRAGALVTTDSSANSVVAITGPFVRGTAYTSVTPGNANNPPPTPGPNYLGTIDLHTGVVSPATTTGVTFATHALLYVPAS
ncbi:MAG: hypothetical protein QOG14_2879 [Mycobacterium sp.]|nr:hypothetical protein [Mycobacterium sp.]